MTVEIRRLQSGLGRRIQTLLRHDCRSNSRSRHRCKDVDVVTGDDLQRLQLLQVCAVTSSPFHLPSPRVCSSASRWRPNRPRHESCRHILDSRSRILVSVKGIDAPCSSLSSWRWKAIFHRARSPGDFAAQTRIARPDCSESQGHLLLVAIFAHQQVPGRSYFGGFSHIGSFIDFVRVLCSSLLLF